MAGRFCYGKRGFSLYYSKNNIIVPIHEASSLEYAILNPISGSFDLMNEQEFRVLQSIRQNKKTASDSSFLVDYLCARGYLYEDREQDQP